MNFDSEDVALEQVQKGDLWGYISFPANYSQAIFDRILSGGDPTNETLENSLISFEMDMTSKSIFSIKNKAMGIDEALLIFKQWIPN